MVDRKEIISKLKDHLHPQLVDKIYPLYDGVMIVMKNGYNVFITPMEKDSSNFSLKGVQAIRDEGLNHLHRLLNEFSFPLDHEDGSKYVANFLKAFSKQPKSEQDKESDYENLHYGPLKDLYSSFYKLGLDPYKEFFLYGNDEIGFRFNKKRRIVLPKEGIKVKVLDDDAYIFYSNKNPGQRYVDVTTVGYMTPEYYYTNSQITKYVEVPKGQHDSVMHQGGETKYLKTELKEGIDLEKENRLKYVLAHNMILTLKIDSKGISHLYDESGEIFISHPDLHLYPMDEFKVE